MFLLFVRFCWHAVLLRRCSEAVLQQVFQASCFANFLPSLFLYILTPYAANPSVTTLNGDLVIRTGAGRDVRFTQGSQGRVIGSISDVYTQIRCSTMQIFCLPLFLSYCLGLTRPPIFSLSSILVYLFENVWALCVRNRIRSLLCLLPYTLCDSIFVRAFFTSSLAIVPCTFSLIATLPSWRRYVS